jgi:hypothetical protein
MTVAKLSLADVLNKSVAEFGARPRVYYDNDEEMYWVGWKSHGGAMTTRLASGMPKYIAEFVLQRFLELVA